MKFNLNEELTSYEASAIELDIVNEKVQGIFNDPELNYEKGYFTREFSDQARALLDQLFWEKESIKKELKGKTLQPMFP